MSDTYELAFETTRDDVLRVSEAFVLGPEWQRAATHYRRRTRRTTLLLSPLIVAATAFFIGRGDSTSGMYGAGALVGVLFAGLMVFGVPRIDNLAQTRRNAIDQVRRADWSALTGPTRIVVDANGVWVRTNARELRLAWSAVMVHSFGTDLLISHGGGDGTIVPMRAFADAAAADEFAARVQHWWQAGQLPAAERITRYLADRDVRCPQCAYNLRGSRNDRCPECGKELSIESLMAAKQ